MRPRLDAGSLAYSTLIGGEEFRRWLDRRRGDPVLVERDGPVLGPTGSAASARRALGGGVDQVSDYLLTDAITQP
ncbi:hypothetical protein BJF90_17315 [Pseudonocardia sp. CNS-004]|nr:hypothetical protein BJF90_17315 [Pseudonocardia sp. CNS-004]